MMHVLIRPKPHCTICGWELALSEMMRHGVPQISSLRYHCANMQCKLFGRHALVPPTLIECEESPFEPRPPL